MTIFRSKIDKHVPLPSRRRASYPPIPWKDMDVGDSHLAKGRELKDILSHIGYYRRAYGWKFVAERKGTGVRVWRVA